MVAQDTFKYMVADGHGGADISTLSIIVFNPGAAYQAGTNTTLNGGNGPNVLDGSFGHDTLLGGNGPDVLIGGPGDILTGGKGPDTYLFRANFGQNTITDFASKEDLIQFSPALFANYMAVMDAAKQVGPDTVIKLDDQNTVTLANIAQSSLSPHNFSFA